MIRSALFALGATLLLSACGWHLRGTLTLPEGLNAVHLNNLADAEILGRTLEQLLVANDVEVTPRATAAQLIISLINYEEERRVVAIGDNTLVTEYELIASADFSVEGAKGEIILPPTDASVVRAYQFDQDDVLAMAGEQELIFEEMRREIAQNIVRRLRFLDLQDQQDVPAAALQP